MKNKFLLLAVVSALFAIVVIPSAFATEQDTDIVTQIESGSFTLTAHGVFSTGQVTLSNITPPVVDTTYSVTTVCNDTDYFKLTDYSANQGARINLALSSSAAGAFVYSGNASATLNNIPVANLKFVPNDGFAPAKAVDAGNRTVNIISASTTDSEEDTSLVDFHTDYSAGVFDRVASNDTAGGSGSYYFMHIMDAPGLMNVCLEKFKLLVPGGSNAGTYTTTLYVIAVDGPYTSIAW